MLRRSELQAARAADESISSLTSEVTRLSSELEAHRRFHSRSRQENDAVADLESALRAERAAAVELRRDLDEERRVNLVRSDELERVRSRAAAAQHELIALRQAQLKRSEPREEKQRALTEIESLRSEVAELKLLLAGAKSELRVLENRRDESEGLEASLRAAREELGVKDAQLDALRQELADARSAGATRVPSLETQADYEEVVAEELSAMRESFEAARLRATEEREEERRSARRLLKEKDRELEAMASKVRGLLERMDRLTKK